MRFLVDTNLPPSFAVWLVSHFEGRYWQFRAGRKITTVQFDGNLLAVSTFRQCVSEESIPR